MAKRTDVKSAAAQLGKLGGIARKKKLSAKRRKEIAAMGGAATKGIKKPRKK
jgi:hypothetical protein